MTHEFKKGGWNPVHPSQRGSETKRAKEHGRSLYEQAEVDEHSPNKKIRGKGIFALNAQKGAFKHRVGPRSKSRLVKVEPKKKSRKRTPRKRG